jgi:hypothetical protein
MATTVRPFLMFEGKAEEAMNFYVSTLPNSAITRIARYGAAPPAPPAPRSRVGRRRVQRLRDRPAHRHCPRLTAPEPGTRAAIFASHRSRAGESAKADFVLL